MKHLSLKLAALALVAVAGGIVVYRASRPAPLKAKPTLVDVARVDRSRADAVYGKPSAKVAYKEFVDKWKTSPDKKVQDEVGAARIRLAYMQAKEKNYKAARATFKEAVREYKGTGTMASDFGGVRDQAAYQAAVCLNAEGKTAEYRAALVEFIKTQPMSPLVHAVYKRLVKLDGKATPEVDQLLQTAVDAQQKQIRFEMSVCGPKALAYLFKLTGKGDFDYKTLAKECGTTDTGTTIEGLRKCMRLHGLEYYGFQVAKGDLPSVAVPAIYYSGDHYYVVTKIDAEAMTAYDPTFERVQRIPIAANKDPQFNAVLLLKSAPSTEVH